MSPAGVPVTVTAHARVAPERAFDVIVPVDLPSIFTGYGPLPAVREVRDQSGPWDRAGQTRTVVLADGSATPERLLTVRRPAYFDYRVGPFGGVLGRVVAHADGAWWFAPEDGGGTAITWTYTFQPRRGGTPAVRAVAPLWRRYAARALAEAVALAEATAP